MGIRLIRNERGIALITVLLVTLVVGVISVGAALISTNSALINRYSDRMSVLEAVADAGGKNALIPFLPLFGEDPAGEGPGLAPGTEGEELPYVRYDDRNTRAALAGSAVSCPPLDAEQIRLYLRYFVESGFLEPPG